MLRRCEIKRGSQGLLELKFLIIMTRLQNVTVAYQLLEIIVAGNNIVLRPGHRYQQQEALANHFDFISFSKWPF